MSYPVRLLFDFGVVSTTDDDCEQHVPSVALRLLQRTTSAAKRRSCLVDNSSGLTPSRTGGRNLAVNVWTYFVYETRISPEKGVCMGSECDNRISDANFLTVFLFDCATTSRK